MHENDFVVDGQKTTEGAQGHRQRKGRAEGFTVDPSGGCRVAKKGRENKMRTRHQYGSIFKKGNSWYGRWREDVLDNNRVVRRQRCEKLADYCDRYRCESDVRPLLEARLRPLNEGKASPQGTLTVAVYFEKFFLSRVKAELKPSTAHGYEELWHLYLGPRVQHAILRDFRCVDATNLLADIHRERGVGRKTLRLCKALLSAVFTHAKQQGVLDGLNPVEDAGIPKAAAAPKPTHAATPDEVMAMLNTLTGAARTAIALIYFCGLRPGEARGARWEDFNGKRLHVRRSIWRTHEVEPKTGDSTATVPVCETLAAILTESRNGNQNGYVLAGPSGKPIDLHNLANRVVIPALRKADIPWHGWYSLRRGAATLAATVESPLAAKGLLRHADLTTTARHYIKDVPEETLRAVEKIDALFNQQAGQPVQ